MAMLNRYKFSVWEESFLEIDSSNGFTTLLKVIMVCRDITIELRKSRYNFLQFVP